MLTIFILTPPPLLPQFNVGIIRQPHVRSIGIISTTLNWGGGQIELYEHYENDIWSLMCLNNFVQDCGYATAHKLLRKTIQYD